MAKPYDSAFKSLADDDPRGLLYLFAQVPLDAEVTMEPLPREVSAPALQVDHVYRVRTGGDDFIWHMEVQTNYRADLPQRMLRYDTALLLKYPGERIRSTLVILAERGTPSPAPSGSRLDGGAVRVESVYEMVRMWELDPKPVLESGRLSLFPWIGVMRALAEDMVAALRRIEAADDQKLRAQAVTMGGIRYDKDEIRALLERISSMIITEDILRQSSVTRDFVRELEERGKVAGRQEGVELGRADEARRIIRTHLSMRFPTLGDAPALDAVTDLERLEQLTRGLIAAEAVEDAAAALASALR